MKTNIGIKFVTNKSKKIAPAQYKQALCSVFVRNVKLWRHRHRYV